MRVALRLAVVSAVAPFLLLLLYELPVTARIVSALPERTLSAIMAVAVFGAGEIAMLIACVCLADRRTYRHRALRRRAWVLVIGTSLQLALTIANA